ncbi:MAG TPA: hypothetical protein VFY40_06140 [Blastocatellia bacterium]|nr:hypothetical protein [Blastocatellia bacterium]
MKILFTLVLFVSMTAMATQSTPKFTKPVMFDTPEADRILAALQVFPPDNPCDALHSEADAARLRLPGATFRQQTDG